MGTLLVPLLVKQQQAVSVFSFRHCSVLATLQLLNVSMVRLQLHPSNFFATLFASSGKKNPSLLFEYQSSSSFPCLLHVLPISFSST
jgi:hypothetical protein